jgi:hypothetical protein
MRRIIGITALLFSFSLPAIGRQGDLIKTVYVDLGDPTLSIEFNGVAYSIPENTLYISGFGSVSGAKGIWAFDPVAERVVRSSYPSFGPRYWDLAFGAGAIYGEDIAGIDVIDPITFAVLRVIPTPVHQGDLGPLAFENATNTLWGAYLSPGLVELVNFTTDGIILSSVPVVGIEEVHGLDFGAGCLIVHSSTYLPEPDLCKVTGSEWECMLKVCRDGTVLEVTHAYSLDWAYDPINLAIPVVWSTEGNGSSLRVYEAPSACPLVPDSVGNTLWQVKQGDNVYATWLAPITATSHNIYRSDTKGVWPSVVYAQTTLAEALHLAQLPSEVYLYSIRASNCTGLGE